MGTGKMRVAKLRVGILRVEVRAKQTGPITIHSAPASMQCRDVVLEASVSARGGFEAVFLAGSASPRPYTVLPRFRPLLPRLCLIVSASVWRVAPGLGSVVISQLKRASAHVAQVQV